jgi:hypothetical protein
MFSSVILQFPQSFHDFLSHFVRHGDGGGRGAGGRGAGCKRTQRSPVGRSGEEEAVALVGEAMGGGGKGAHRWWGNASESPLMSPRGG